MLYDIQRTNRPHGISPHEVRRLTGCIHCMRTVLPKRTAFWFTVLGDHFLQLLPNEKGEVLDDFKQRLGIAQDRSGLPRYNVAIFEVTGGLHTNIIFPAEAKSISSFQNTFDRFVGANNAIQPVTDWQGLRNYLSKEATPQAQHLVQRRMKGSHKCEGLGDRVVPSKSLKRKAISMGSIEPWTETRNKRNQKENRR